MAGKDFDGFVVVVTGGSTGLAGPSPSRWRNGAQKP